MTRVAAALLVGVALVAGLIAVLQSRDESAVERSTDVPGDPAPPPGGLAGILRQGNVIVMHTGPKPADLGADSPELRQAGQAVITDRVRGLPAPYVAHSATHRQTAQRPEELREFVDYWLGGRS